jgi:hypothetical protein
MMFQRPIIAFLTLVASVAITGCTITTGDGPIVEKTIEMEPFHSVNIDGSFDVFISQAVSQSVVVATQSNILEHFKMNVMDGVLYLSMAPGSYMSYDLAVKVAMPIVSSIELDGSGDVEIGTFVGLHDLSVKLDGSGDIKGTGALEVLSEATIDLQGSGDIELTLKAKQVELILDGSGDIEVTGQTNKLVANLNGSGDIDAMELESIDSDANLDGSGKIKVFASGKLKASLQGSGDIRYDGKPDVEAKIDGSGTIQAD